MQEAIQVWIPLADRAVALFVETLRGPAPTLEHAPSRKALSDPSRKNFMRSGPYPIEDENLMRE